MAFDFLKKSSTSNGSAPPEAKASASAKLTAWASSGRAVWSPRDSGTLIRNGFLGNPVGFRAVRLLSEATAALPVICRDSTRRYEQHPILDLVSRPNAGQGRAELIEAAMVQMMLSGSIFFEAVPSEDGGTPLELHVLRSDRMSIVPGADGWPRAYDYKIGAKKHRFAAELVCHIKSFHPTDDHHGLAPIQAAATAIDVHNAAARWSKGLLDNAARPSGAIVYRGLEGGGTMSADQFDRLQMELESHHQGARNAGRPMLLEGGLDWKPMGFSPSDMEFQKTKEAAARDIALAFGVPPMLLGLPGDATYANYAEANRAFYRLSVLPMAHKIWAGVGHWLSRLSGEVVELTPDLDAIPALAPEREAQWRRISEADFLSPGEKRRLLGLPESPDA